MVDPVVRRVVVQRLRGSLGALPGMLEGTKVLPGIGHLEGVVAAAPAAATLR
jgi:hypothetical protein